MVFPFAALALKRAIEKTRDLGGVIFVCNVVLALVFLPLFLKAAHPVPTSAYWQPLLAGFLFFLGQVAAFKSFQGELSIAIPVQGAKVLLVAFFAQLILGQSVDARTWVASGLSVAAIHFLRDEGGADPRLMPAWLTLIYAGFAALALAGFDIAVQKWTPGWEAHRFGPWVFLTQAFFSLTLLREPHPGRFRYGAEGWGWLLPGALGMALITFVLVMVIGTYGKATEVNLLYNSRCIWGVAAVWLAGKWFGNREAGRGGRRRMSHRLGGAGLMMAAIAMALL
jgi:hypothetical protein